MDLICVCIFDRCTWALQRKPLSRAATLSIFLTSNVKHVLLLDGGVQLQCELRRGAQEGLDDGGAFEGVPVHGQDALRLAYFPLHWRALPFLQADLPGDGHIGLLPLTCLEVDHEGLGAPARDTVSESGRECSYTFLPVEGSAWLHFRKSTTACFYALTFIGIVT